MKIENAGDGWIETTLQPNVTRPKRRPGRPRKLSSAEAAAEFQKSTLESLAALLTVKTMPGRYERLLRPPEAAAFLGISIKTLWYWRRWDTGPSYYRVGRSCVGYLLRDLEAFRQRWRVEPANAGGGAQGNLISEP